MANLGIRTDASGTFGALTFGGVDVVKVVPTGVQDVMPTPSYANDAAAAIAGVPIGGLYHTAGAVKVRLV